MDNNDKDKINQSNEEAKEQLIKELSENLSIEVENESNKKSQANNKTILSTIPEASIEISNIEPSNEQKERLAKINDCTIINIFGDDENLVSFYGAGGELENLVNNLNYEKNKNIIEGYLSVIKIMKIGNEQLVKLTQSIDNNDLLAVKKIIDKVEFDGKMVTKINDFKYLLMKSKDIGNDDMEEILNNKEYSNDLFAWRDIKPGEDSFYRAIIFSYLEYLILSNDFEQYKYFLYDLSNNITDKYFSQILEFYKIDIKKVKILLALIYYAINYGNRENFIEKALTLFMKAYNMDEVFDLFLILNLKFVIYKYIRSNERRYYSKETKVIMGEFLPDNFKKNGKYLFNKYYENNLLQLTKGVDKIAISVIPFIFRRNLYIYSFDKKKINLTFVHADNQQNKEEIPFRIVNLNGSYDIIYGKDYYCKYLKLFSIYSNIPMSNVKIKANNENVQNEGKLRAKISNNDLNANTNINTNNINTLNMNNNNSKEISMNNNNSPNSNIVNNNINNQNNNKNNNHNNQIQNNLNNNQKIMNNINKNDLNTNHQNNINVNNNQNFLKTMNSKTSINNNSNSNKNLLNPMNIKNNMNNNLNTQNNTNNNQMINKGFSQMGNQNININNSPNFNNNNFNNMNNNINPNMNNLGNSNQNINNIMINNTNTNINNNMVNNISNTNINNNTINSNTNLNNSNNNLTNSNTNISNNNINIQNNQNQINIHTKANTVIEGNSDGYINTQYDGQTNLNVNQYMNQSHGVNNTNISSLLNQSTNKNCPLCKKPSKDNFYCENCLLNHLIPYTNSNYIEFVKNNINNIIHQKPSEDFDLFVQNLNIIFPNGSSKPFNECYYLLSDQNKNYFNEQLNEYKKSICLGCFNFIKKEENEFIENMFYRFPCGCIFCSSNCLNRFLKALPLKSMKSFICGCGKKYQYIQLKYLLYFSISFNLKFFKKEIMRYMYEYIKTICCKCKRTREKLNKENINMSVLELIDQEGERIFNIHKFNHLICDKCNQAPEMKKNKFYCNLCVSEHKKVSNNENKNYQMSDTCSIY